MVADLERRARGEPLFTWVKAVASQRAVASVAFRNTQWVTGEYPDLLDVDAPNDSPLKVAAVARSFHNDSMKFHVVTDDLLPKPTREPLGAVCDDAGWPHECVADFLRCVGLDHRLA